MEAEEMAYEMETFNDGRHPTIRGVEKIKNNFNVTGVMSKREVGEDKRVDVASYVNKYVAEERQKFQEIFQNLGSSPVPPVFHSLKFADQQAFHTKEVFVHGDKSSTAPKVAGIAKPVKTLSLKGRTIKEVGRSHRVIKRFFQCDPPIIPFFVDPNARARKLEESETGVKKREDHQDEDEADFIQPVFCPPAFSAGDGVRPPDPLEIVTPILCTVLSDTIEGSSRRWICTTVMSSTLATHTSIVLMHKQHGQNFMVTSTRC